MRKVLKSKASDAPLVKTVEADKPLKRLLKLGRIFRIKITFLVLIIAFVTLPIVISKDQNPIATPWNDQDALYSRQKRQSTRYDETIQTITSLGNFQADPCNDFHEYACGNFLKAAPPPPHKASWNSFSWAADGINHKLKTLLMSNDEEESSAVRKTKKYYKSCVEPPSSELGALLEVIKNLGGWPLMDSNWNEEAWSLKTALQVAMQYQCFPLLQFRTAPISNPPGTVIRKSELTLSEPDEALAPEAFKQAVSSTLQKLLEVDGKGGEEISEEITNQMTEMWTFEQDLAEIMIDPGPFTFAPKILSQIEPIFSPWLDLRSLMAAYFNSSIEPTDKAVFQDSYYFNNLTTLISNNTNKVLANYVVWTVVRSITTDIDTQFKSAEELLKLLKKETSQNDDDQRVPVPRWQTCMKEVIDKFEFSIALPYIKHHIEPSYKNEVQDMCEMIIKVAKKHQPDFFDEETMKNTIEKLSKTKCVTAYPSFVLNITSLDQFYDKYQLGSNYLHNDIQHRLFLTHLSSTQYGRKYNPEIWFASPMFLNAYVFHMLNQMTLFGAMLHSPLFHPQFSPEVSLGSIGVILAHELSHVFLPPGNSFDGDGNRRGWYTEATSTAYKDVEQCYIGQYGELKMFNRTINGGASSKENMADSGGLWLAFQSLLESYGGGKRGWKKLEKSTEFNEGRLNRGQLFFVAYAQKLCSFYDEKSSANMFNSPHTFNNIRMQGTLQNSEEFSRVFNCPSNSPLNPSSKCHIYRS